MTNEQDRRWTVYLHVVPKQLSGYDWDKYYVGITSICPTYRWGSNGNGYKLQPYFYNAIQKYDWGNIRHLIIKDDLTKEQAVIWEKEYIRIYQSHDPAHGYNLTIGGEGTTFLGRKHSEKTKKLISQNHADVTGSRNPNSRLVFQFDLNGTFIRCFGSAAEATKEYTNRTGCSDIAAVANNQQKTAFGFIWKYSDGVEYVNGTYEMISKYSLTPKRLTSKEIQEYDLNGNLVQIYSSGAELGRKYQKDSKSSRYSAVARGAYRSKGNEFERRRFGNNYYFYSCDDSLIKRFLDEYIPQRKECVK